MERKEEFILTEQRLVYLLKHFSSISESYRTKLNTLGISDKLISETCEAMGSKFNPVYIKNPEDLLSEIYKGKETTRILQLNGNSAMTVKFNYNIGTEGIIASNELTSEEKNSITNDVRNGYKVKIVKLNSFKASNSITYIINSNKEIVTVFPGRYAPPFPFNEMPLNEHKISSDFWDKHLFVELI